MSNTLNLLLLNSSEDIHPRSWICLYGKRLGKIFRKLEKDALSHYKTSRENLSRLLAAQLRCSHGVIKQLFQDPNRFYPIPVILKLLNTNRDAKKIIKEINDKTELVKVNSASAKPVRAVSEISPTLAKVLGAFMADGSLSIQVIISTPLNTTLHSASDLLDKLDIKYSNGTALSRSQHYLSFMLNSKNFSLIDRIFKHSIKSGYFIQTHHNFDLTEEYKDSVDAFNNWILEIFGIKPVSFYKKQNAWRTIFSNKVLGRYLIKFFGAIPGQKTYTAFESNIIKKSGLEIRKNFARGVLMFDGCVTKNKKIIFSTKSKLLRNAIKDIWSLDEINYGSWVNKKNEYILFTTSGNTKEKLLRYFEQGTQKEKLLHWLDGDTNHSPITDNHRGISIKNVQNTIRKIEKCDAIFLKNYFKCSHSTIRTYLKILSSQKIIKLTSRPSDGITHCVDRNIYISLGDKFHTLVFQNIEDNFKTMKNFGDYLEIDKGVLSNWKLKKARIPLWALKEFCGVLELDFENALKNVIETDREIAEIIL